MKNFKRNLFVLGLFISSVGYSQITGQVDAGDMYQDNAFEDYDADRDAYIDRDEFYDRNTEDFDQWDTNLDETVDEREFYDYQFDRLDVDRDRNLSPEEWEIGYDNVYGDYFEYRDFNQYDRDRNQMLTEDEFDDTMRDTYMYSDFDTNRDRRVDTDELTEGIYNRMDRNQDDRIDRDEFDEGYTYYTGTLNDPQGF